VSPLFFGNANAHCPLGAPWIALAMTTNFWARPNRLQPYRPLRPHERRPGARFWGGAYYARCLASLLQPLVRPRRLMFARPLLEQTAATVEVLAFDRL